MTKSLANPEGLDAADRKFLSDIDRVGWHITNILRRAGEEDDGTPDWSFSCGLYSNFHHPEIVMFGLDSERRTDLINIIGHQVKDGKRFETSDNYGDIFERCLCAFRPVHQSWYADYLGLALWFYETYDFPVIQAFWPDKADLYPWEVGCNSFVRGQQPLLFHPKAPTEE